MHTLTQITQYRNALIRKNLSGLYSLLISEDEKLDFSVNQYEIVKVFISCAPTLLTDIRLKVDWSPGAFPSQENILEFFDDPGHFNDIIKVLLKRKLIFNSNVIRDILTIQFIGTN